MNDVKIKYKTLLHLNKKVYFFGMSSLQIAALVGINVMLFLIHIIIGIMSLAASIILMRYCHSKTRKGMPSPIESFMNVAKAKKKVMDDFHLFKYL